MSRTSPFAGEWTFNPAKSTLHRLTQIQSATLGLDIDGNAVKIDYVIVEPSGHIERGVNAFVADGHEHPSTIRAGAIMRARWLSSHGLEAVASRDGEVEGRVEYLVSPDGHTLTLSSKGPDGFAQTGVFERM